MSRSLNFYLGLALVTAAVLMFQIIDTRILSVISWYYLSFFVIGMAMFGLTAGAVWVYLQGDRFSGGSLSRDALVRFTSNLRLDLTPTTDERPFFFNQLPLYNLGKFFGETLPGLRQGVAAGNLRAALTLVILIGLSLCLVVGTILVPLRPAIAAVGRRLAFGGTAYFFLIGAGFMVFEIALLQRTSVFLGHPIYSLSIVLFSVILSTGFGSLLSDRVVLGGLRRFVAPMPFYVRLPMCVKFDRLPNQ